MVSCSPPSWSASPWQCRAADFPLMPDTADQSDPCWEVHGVLERTRGRGSAHDEKVDAWSKNQGELCPGEKGWQRGSAPCLRLSVRAASQSSPGSLFISGVPWAASGPGKGEQMFALLPPLPAQCRQQGRWDTALCGGYGDALPTYSKRGEPILTSREEQGLLTHRLVI